MLFLEVYPSDVAKYQFIYKTAGTEAVSTKTGKLGRDTSYVYTNTHFDLNKYYYLPLTKNDSILTP